MQNVAGVLWTCFTSLVARFLLLVTRCSKEYYGVLDNIQ